MPIQIKAKMFKKHCKIIKIHIKTANFFVEKNLKKSKKNSNIQGKKLEIRLLIYEKMFP